jgi:DNA-binding beta-propeller fold protein YncE
MNFEGFIDLPRTGSLALFDQLALSEHSLYAAETISGALYKIDLNSGSPSKTIGVARMTGEGAVHGVAVLPFNELGFLARSGKNAVDVFAPSTLRQLGSIPVADGAAAFTYDPDSRLVFMGNVEANLGTIIDPDRGATVGIIRLPGRPEFAAVDSATGLLYQNFSDLNDVAAIDLRTQEIVGRWSLAPCRGPIGMAIDPEQRRLYSVCVKTSTMVIFDLDYHRVVSKLKVGLWPDSVAVDPVLHRVYVTGATGTLMVIEQYGPDSYRVVDKVITHVLARAMAVDPATHKVYVAYAGLFAAPRVAMFSPKGEGPAWPLKMTASVHARSAR